MLGVYWIFCTVIDHFGDVGVSWRLARELRSRFNAQVFLWLDDAALLPMMSPDGTHGIVLKSWREGEWADLDDVPAPDVVLETFACALPESVLVHIRTHGAVWLNWEYLSAEAWAVRTHGMRSVQADGTAKYFWQMGFVPESGGLLREQSFRLPERSDALPLPDLPETIRVFWFAYDDAVWTETVRAWLAVGRTMVVDIASIQVLNALWRTGFLPADALQNVGDVWVSGCLTLCRLGFVPQVAFDDLLAQYDLLMVRGEDSFVRAQFSGKPFFWHIYPQDEGAHWVKLAAFWALLRSDDAVDWWQAHQALSDEMNGVMQLSARERVAHWQALWTHWADGQRVARRWQSYLFQQDDAISRLAKWLANETGNC